MAKTGFERGSNQGILQGVKTGFGMSPYRSGFLGGITDGTANMDKLQDPVVLASARTDCPFFFWNADNLTLSGNTVTAVTNLLGTFNPLTQSAISSMSVLGSPLYVARDMINNRASVNFGNTAQDAFSTDNAAVPNMTNTSEMTLMLVCKPSATGILFWKKDTGSDPPALPTIGDLDVRFNGTDITVSLVGNPTSQTATYKTSGVIIKDTWVIVTVKARLSLPQGAGSCLDIYVNSLQSKNLVTDTITSLPTIATDTWQNNYINFGNNGSSVSGGTQPGGKIAAGLIIEQWINESEQLRLENYFRDYYGYKF
jgi:hypothetical protein